MQNLNKGIAGMLVVLLLFYPKNIMAAEYDLPDISYSPTSNKSNEEIWNLPPLPEIPAKKETKVVGPEITEDQLAVSRGKRLANEALKLVGVTNGLSCTEVASIALRNAGIKAGIHWPDSYVTYGEYVEEPQPGDLIFYNNGGRGVDHIAIYIGDDLAVHGNFDGMTLVASAYICPGPPQWIRIDWNKNR